MKAPYLSTMAEVAGLCAGRVICGDPGRAIETVTTDSRDLGSRSLFIPLKGEKFDGHDYIAPLCREGKIDGFLTMKEGIPASGNGPVTGIRCENTLHALGSLASSWRRKTGTTVIGVTGTNGKTTVKELLSALLSRNYPCHKNEKNYNNEIGVPFALLNLKHEHRMAVIEMGMNHPGELDRLSRISVPDAAVITNIGEGHLEFLGSVEKVARAKCEIMNGMKGGTLYLNRETECFSYASAYAVERGISVKTFGLSGGADVRPDGYRLFPGRIEVTLQKELLTVPLYGIHNVYNILAAAAVAGDYGVTVREMNGALEGFSGIGGRSQVLEKGFTVINDTYNSNPLSSRYAIMSAGEVFKGKRIFAVLSDMKELGMEAESLHVRVGRELAPAGFHALLAWGDMAGAYVRGARESGMDASRAIAFPDKKGIVAYLRDHAGKDDVILVKGSRSMKMEEIVEELAK